MPEQLPPPQVFPVDLESAPLKDTMSQLEDAYALSVVTETFSKYEIFRTNNHDARWNEHDALYFGAKPPKVWEGTSVARSSLGMAIVFDQIETVVPFIMQALFGEPNWFQVEPEPGASPQEAKAVEAHLQYRLDHRDGMGAKVASEIEHAVRSVLLYGNGGVVVEWDPEKQAPVASWADLRDIYVDTACPTPNTDEARSVIWRRFMTLDEVDSLRSDPRFKIPPRAVLMYLANNPLYASADATKRNQEALRGVNSTAQYDNHLPLPNDRRMEVLIYYSKSQIIWTLNRQWVAYNQPNPYGFMPFCFAPCFPVLGRFYAQSYADVLQPLQMYIEALYNAHLDEVNLAIHPPRAMKAGLNMTPAQSRWRPGMMAQLTNPKEDMVVQFPQGMTANVAQDIEYLEAAAQKRTGVNTLSMGLPAPSNANRTKGGMAFQLQGTNSRVYAIVRNIEDYLIVPMLYKMYKLIQFHTFPQQLLPALGKDAQYFQVGAQAFRAPVRFKMFAASKMLTREKLAQVVPFLFQNLFQGPFVQGIQQTGKTIDFDVLTEMLQDATGTGRRYPFIRPMNQQEQQALHAPPPQVVADQQKSQLDAQVRLAMGKMKADSDLAKVQAQKSTSPQEQQSKMMEMLMKMKMDREKHQANLQAQRQKMVLDAAGQQQKLAHDRQKMHQDLISQLLQHRMNAATQAHTAQTQMRQNEQNMHFEAQRHHQGLQMDRESHSAKLEAQKKQLALRQKQMAMKKPAAKPQPKKAA